MANSKGYGARGFSRLARQREAEQLTAKERRFVEEYLVDTDQTNAARRAGYSHKSAPEIACQLMKKPKIGNAIGALMRARSEETRIDASYLLSHLAEMLKADIGDIVDENGAYLPIHRWPKIWRQMLSGLDVEQLWGYDDQPESDGKRNRDRRRIELGRVLKLKFVDRLRVIELIGRHVDVSAFEQPVEQHAHTHVHVGKSTAELEAHWLALNARVREQLSRQKALEARTIEAEVVRA